ncbi:MAG: DNA mismatch repair endonuclease MutL [Deltaproteobacteria bacterium]|nr:MAG: DNA mismatch repair endonuclease MutL [Deltaproteobacteria bacterium]
MAGKIKVLPEQLSNKIAAGEVVERPASVVKELVENSLDAGSSRISVEVEEGGKRLIRVIDDGEGLGREDAKLAFERWATSKIYQEEELHSISTLGFRGEALASIASVSRVVMITKVEGALAGTRVKIEGGKILEVADAGCPQGTDMEVKELFFNTPARKKFLKSTNTELGWITENMNRFTLGFSEVDFKLIHNGKSLLRASAKMSPLDRAVEALGGEVKGNLFPVSFSTGKYVISGYISQPDYNRASSKGLYTFVNHRYVQDRVINHAIIEAYRDLGQRNRFPVAVIFLEMPLELVDVNVHPMKREVRFRDQNRVHDAIVSAIQNTLREAPWVKDKTEGEIEKDPDITSRRREYRKGVQEALAKYSFQEKETITKKGFPKKYQLKIKSDEQYAPELTYPDRKEGFYSSLQIIGQAANTYIICQSSDSLFLIDQHAAQERITFVHLKEGYSKTKIARQSLLFPETMELGYQEAKVLEKHQEELKELGMELEHFGGNTFIIKAVPELLSNANYRELIRDLIDELSNDIKSKRLEDKIDEILILMACHSAVRANQPLTDREIESLLQSLDEVEYSSNCPHGRPVVKEISFKELEKMFNRR